MSKPNEEKGGTGNNYPGSPDERYKERMRCYIEKAIDDMPTFGWKPEELRETFAGKGLRTYRDFAQFGVKKEKLAKMGIEKERNSPSELEQLKAEQTVQSNSGQTESMKPTRESILGGANWDDINPWGGIEIFQS
jgi:hypothetical protein